MIQCQPRYWIIYPDILASETAHLRYGLHKRFHTPASSIYLRTPSANSLWAVLVRPLSTSFFRRTWFVVSTPSVARSSARHISCSQVVLLACLCTACALHLVPTLYICFDTPSCTVCDTASGALLLIFVRSRFSIVMYLPAITYDV